MYYFQEANELYQLEDYRNAITMYKKSMDKYKNKKSIPVCLYNTAVCHIKLKEYETAIPFLESALKLKTQSIYFFNLGYCYAMVKDYKKALIYFNTAWSLDDTDKDCEKAINLIVKSLRGKAS